MRKKVAKNFYLDEFACKCGRPECDAVPPTPELIRLTQAIRDELGTPFSPTSACRCPLWNAKVGGAKKSKHVTGEAVDIPAYGGDMRFLIIEAAIKHGAKGIGIGKTFVHVDTRKNPIAWGYGQAD